MVRNAKMLADFEARELKKEKLSYNQALKIFEAMWQEGLALGVLPLKDPLEGIEAKINLARILNLCSKNL